MGYVGDHRVVATLLPISSAESPRGESVVDDNASDCGSNALTELGNVKKSRDRLHSSRPSAIAEDPPKDLLAHRARRVAPHVYSHDEIGCVDGSSALHPFTVQGGHVRNIHRAVGGAEAATADPSPAGKPPHDPREQQESLKTGPTGQPVDGQLPSPIGARSKVDIETSEKRRQCDVGQV